MTNKAYGSAMKKAKKRELKPNLRFPEFRDAPGWVKKVLGGLFSNRQETGLAELRLLSLTDKEGIIPQESTNRKNNSNSDKSKYLRVVPGDIAYNTMRMWEGRSAFVGMEGLISPAYTVCEPNDGVDALCFSYYFKTPQLIEQFRRYSQGLVKDTLNLKFEAFARIVVPSPPPAEQYKIAACLSSMDELIVAHNRKLDALKAYKKGLMQQLFPREGETVPRLRFPEFQNVPEWKERKLEDLAKRGSGHTPSKSKSEYYGGGIKWVSLADSKRLDEGLIYETAIELSAEGIKNSSAVLHPEGCAILSRDAGVGKSAITSCPMAVSQHFIAWDCHDDQLSNWFLYYLLQRAKPMFESIATGSTIKTIGLQFFVQMRVTVPLRAEQQRIADGLSSLGDRITAQTQKLDALKTHKKGLMQQLFPSPEACD